MYMYIYIYIFIIEKLAGTERTDRNTMDFGAKPLRKSRETYWMHYEQFFQRVLMSG